MARNPNQQQALQPVLLSAFTSLWMLSVGLWTSICKETYSTLKGKEAASPLGRPEGSRRGSECEAPHKWILRWGLPGVPISAGNCLFTNWLCPILELISFFTPFLLRGCSRVSPQLSSNHQSEYIQAGFTSKPNLHLCPNTAFYPQ